MKVLRPIWNILISLKLAVSVMVGLTLSLIAATTMESMFDTPTAQYWVYRTTWFYGLLFMLGVNILCVALSRLPWQKKHLPFLTAHLGIILLLYGSWVTYQFGIDGMLQVDEGSDSGLVEINEPLLVISEPSGVKTLPMVWHPPNAKFKPLDIPEYGLRVVEMLSHADPEVKFIPTSDESTPKKDAALKLKIQGGPKAPPFMRAGQEFWMWQADPSWSIVKVGAAQGYFGKDLDPVLPAGVPSVGFRFEQGQKVLKYWIRTTEGKLTQGRLPFNDPKELEGKVLQTGWKFEATVSILEFIPNAKTEVKYVPSTVQYGNSAPPSAIRIKVIDSKSPDAEVWLGLGERATLYSKGVQKTVGYFPRRISLPFAIHLNRFDISRYPGSMSPKEFSSRVEVKGRAIGNDLPPSGEVLISMNEPMKHGGFVFYQSSYIDAQPRPTTSIFSVNQDPGRWLKYLGSLLITLGAVWLFLNRYRLRKVAGPAA